MKRPAGFGYAIFIALVLECILLALTTDAFFTTANLGNVIRQNAFTAILAAGMTFVVLTAGIDLSVGSVVGLAGMVCATVMVQGTGVVAGVLSGVAVGILTGMVNGAAVTMLRVPPFVVTLATMLIVRGAAYKLTDARTISGLPAAFGALSSGVASATLMLAIFVVAWLLLVRTPFGRHVYAVGGNAEAAWLSGVRVGWIQFAVYTLSGLAAGIAGVLVASRLNAGVVLVINDTRVIPARLFAQPKGAM